jgi:riboflavin kinase/FMN adenylyltransferase
MKVIYGTLPSKRIRCVVTIGAFDGIHRGHQFILHTVVKEAKKLKALSLVITFDILPQQFFRKNPSLNSWRSPKPFLGCLSDVSQRTALIRSLGLDYLWFLKTDRRLLELPPRDFIDYVNGRFQIGLLIVGEDFRFGVGSSGDVGRLQEFAREYRFGLKVLKKRRKNKTIISSSLIRSLIAKGKLNEASCLLGRLFSLKGTVARGRRLGSRLNFPTANIVPSDFVLPSRGVYASYVFLDSKAYVAVVNIGTKPTVTSSRKTTLEAHIVDFRGNILGRTVEVVFLEKLRNERKFPSLQALTLAIQRDLERTTAKYGSPLKKHAQLIVP